ncbi:abortive infection family protein [Hyphomicrobium sp. MC8b]|uniref:abortive infection family protein n=1 Tax=Hyphomicrobium sp. MC8b TaxID=300273 RepID=UPI0039193FE2
MNQGELLDKALALQTLLIDRATGQPADVGSYAELRRAILADLELRKLAPSCIRECRDLDAFWSWIKQQSATYEGRRVLIRSSFADLLQYLEDRPPRHPSDLLHASTLSAFDTGSVRVAWEKALLRRDSDPEGAITAARTLLETVCKHVLAVQSVEAPEDGDLPKLYRLAAQTLGLAPSQHTEEAFRSILGGCTTVVNGLATLRNRIGDAHGAGPLAVRPSPRHAALAVNLAGAMASFLVETWEARRVG